MTKEATERQSESHPEAMGVQHARIVSVIAFVCVPRWCGLGFFCYTSGEFISVTLVDFQMDMHLFLNCKVLM